MKVESIVGLATLHIEKLIITGKLKPGEQIKEEDIANSLSISRPPVREALNCLEGEGLVIRKPRKGAFVFEMNEKDIWEVYTLKAELYAMAIYGAIDVITDKQINQLQSLYEKMKKITNTKQSSILKYQKLHRAFHVKIMEIAGNQRLSKFASSLHKQIRRYSFLTLSYEEHLHVSNRYHEQIVDMIVKKNKENACKLMKEHVLNAMHFLLSISNNLSDFDLKIVDS
ncbi:GntR family transcriptional regulator [bacterium]|nr:GntR family transcriptional regulator [bacterium]